MASGQFRFAYFTPIYDETVAFYRDGLGLPVIHAWNRSPDDRGTLIGVASGMVEVLALPKGEGTDHFFDERPPQGAFMVIEVDNVEDTYCRVVEKGLSIQQQLMDQSWGHRSFCVRDPNGLTLYFFSPRAKLRRNTPGMQRTSADRAPSSSN